MPDLTAIQKSWDDAGKNYPVSATEGSLYPFDDSSMSGWCGEDSAGDRVTFLMFDISDFDRDGLGSVQLRMTPKSFPSRASVEVRGGCETNWYENSLTWKTAPIIADAREGKKRYPNPKEKIICEWKGDEEIMYYEEPLTCDVTNVTRISSTKNPGYMCLTIDMVHATTNSREPVVFWSRELDEQAERTIAVSVYDSFMGNANPSRGAALEFGTVAGGTDSYSWKPHLLIKGSGCGRYPEHSAHDLPCSVATSS